METSLYNNLFRIRLLVSNARPCFKRAEEEGGVRVDDI